MVDMSIVYKKNCSLYALPSGHRDVIMLKDISLIAANRYSEIWPDGTKMKTCNYSDIVKRILEGILLSGVIIVRYNQSDIGRRILERIMVC